jgi:hypothetical protein
MLRIWAIISCTVSAVYEVVFEVAACSPCTTVTRAAEGFAAKGIAVSQDLFVMAILPFALVKAMLTFFVIAQYNIFWSSVHVYVGKCRQVSAVYRFSILTGQSQ